MEEEKRPLLFQLATFALDGHPATRTVVFRGFHGETEQLLFATDMRSAKVEEINAHGWGEACWYAAESGEQFRIAGNIRIIDHTTDDPALGADRRAIWDSLSDDVRKQFHWPPPGRDRDEKEEMPTKHKIELADPPDNFGLLLLIPIRIDYVDLRTRPHRRILSRPSPAGDWFERDVNP